MLRLDNISVSFNVGTPNEVKALKNLSLQVKEGEFITVIGPNGAGKSTLFNVIAGTVPIAMGHIYLDDTDITNWPEYKCSLEIGRVFQNPALGTCADLTIRENLSLADMRGRRPGLRAAVKKGNEAQLHELVKDINLGLETRMDTNVGLLSGGQRQALALAMAGMKRPKLLLLDEHTAALDPNASHQVIDLTVKLIEEFHLTVIMITHSMQQAVDVGNRILMMDRGNILFDLSGPERKNLQYHHLIERFRALHTGTDLTDRTILS
ncbi:MAG: ATP-binding cassette domain-containing protein [Candidatus Promineifilaceae bacterium]